MTLVPPTYVLIEVQIYVSELYHPINIAARIFAVHANLGTSVFNSPV